MIRSSFDVLDSRLLIFAKIITSVISLVLSHTVSLLPIDVSFGIVSSDNIFITGFFSSMSSVGLRGSYPPLFFFGFDFFPDFRFG